MSDDNLSEIVDTPAEVIAEYITQRVDEKHATYLAHLQQTPNEFEEGFTNAELEETSTVSKERRNSINTSRLSIGKFG